VSDQFTASSLPFHRFARSEKFKTQPRLQVAGKTPNPEPQKVGQPPAVHRKTGCLEKDFIRISDTLGVR
jgi:hypothetical protein